MSQLSINKFGDNLAVTGIVALSQALMGFGAGMLLGDRVSRSVRQTAAIACFTGGALALVPLISGIVVNVRNRPTSSRRMRKQLESIREDTGLSSSEDEQF